MACGNGRVCTRIIIKASRIIDPCRLHHLLKETLHAIPTIKKPPGRPQAQGWIMPGQRSKLPTIGSFIQGKEDNCQVTLTTKEVEQGFEIMRKFTGKRNVRTHITPETF